MTPSKGSAALALRFISGKYRGNEVPLTEGAEIIVGRSGDLGMVLAEDMVSRRHARIAIEDGTIFIEDLGSTNGTFVNGEKVSSATLKEGDRVLIGTNILRVVAAEPAKARRATQEPTSGQSRTMAGSINEIPIPDLLQLLGSSKKSGVLLVKSEDDVGKLFLRKGDLVAAVINDMWDVPGLKSAFRMITWGTGSFELLSLEAHPAPTHELDRPVTVQEVLMEGLRQIDELAALRDQLPELDATLSIPRPLAKKLSDLSRDELDMLQEVHNQGQLNAVLNTSAATDLDVARTVLTLLKKGYLTSS
jgi:hypothetical protein